MKRAITVAAFAALGCAGAEAQPLAPSPQFKASMDLASALRSRDMAKIMESFTDDAVILPPGRDLVGGRKDVEELVKELVGKNKVEVAFSSLGSAGAGNLGFDVGQYELTLQPEAGGTKKKTRGKYLAVLKQDAQERWRLGYLSWNNSEPETPPASPSPAK